MLRGFYTAASGMLTQQRTINVLSNNLANIYTPGYRTERVVSSTFAQELMVRREAGRYIPIGTNDTIRVIEDVATKFDPSSLVDSERPFDMALNCDGFFNIEAEDGTVYLTRNGNFDRDEEGYLVLPGMGHVLGEGGAIQLENADFTVRDDGTILDSEGEELDRILVTQPAEEAVVLRAGNGMFVLENDGDNVEVEQISVKQNMLERSNADLNREYTLVMEAQRNFQSCASALKMIDQINQKTATQIASL